MVVSEFTGLRLNLSACNKKIQFIREFSSWRTQFMAYTRLLWIWNKAKHLAWVCRPLFVQQFFAYTRLHAGLISFILNRQKTKSQDRHNVFITIKWVWYTIGVAQEAHRVAPISDIICGQYSWICIQETNQDKNKVLWKLLSRDIRSSSTVRNLSYKII